MTERTTVELSLPEPVYRQLESQPPGVRQMALQFAVQAIREYLEKEAAIMAGREMLLRLADEAEHYQDSPAPDLAEHHDDYLYGEG